MEKLYDKTYVLSEDAKKFRDMLFNTHIKLENDSEFIMKIIEDIIKRFKGNEEGVEHGKIRYISIEISEVEFPKE